MNRTENDLRAAYIEPTGTESAERRLIDACHALRPGERRALSAQGNV